MQQHLLIKIFYLFPLFLSFDVKSQVVTDSISLSKSPKQDSVQDTKEKDLLDLVGQFFHKKPSLKSDNIKPGDKRVFSILPAAGYTLQTRFAVVLSGNSAFYSSNDPTAKLSVVSINTFYTQNKQFSVPVESNIWLKGNKYNLLGDWRYMKYPQSTYGLGSNTKLSMEDPMKWKYIRFYQYVLKKVTNNFSAGIGYTLDYHFQITEKGPINGSVSDYSKYGTDDETISSGPALIFIYDNRNNPINPTKSFYASFVIRDNLKWMGSTSNWQSANLDIRKYFTFPAHSNNTLAIWSYNWIVLSGKPPYLDLPSNGWDSFNNTGRGFIQGRFRGNVMVYLESEYRFNITANKLFGGVVFANAESFSNGTERKLQSIQPAFGAGLRIKLNKKSNTNICLDYGIGTQGMKGFFINVGEVF